MIKLDGHIIKATIFPDGTSQVWHLPEELLGRPQHVINWKFESEDELFHVAQLKHLLDAHNLDGLSRVALEMPYLPYGRQDKFVTNKNTFALTSFARIINTLNFEIVSCVDAHSESASFIINNFYPVSAASFICDTLDILGPKDIVLCFPDKGASQKYSKMFPNRLFIKALKERNSATGAITSYKLDPTCSNVTDLKILIVDDICDGGATFIALAKLLKEAGAKEINLYVSHGLFTKGTKVLRDAGINRIFTKEGEIK